MASSLGARSGETTPATASLEEGTLASAPIAVPKRILMGPGPSNAHPRVLAAQGGCIERGLLLCEQVEMEKVTRPTERERTRR